MVPLGRLATIGEALWKVAAAASRALRRRRTAAELEADMRQRIRDEQKLDRVPPAYPPPKDRGR
jgi:hypothetical protein